MKYEKGHIPWNKGIPYSQEIKDKISESLKGRTVWNKGIPMSIEMKRKMGLTKHIQQTNHCNLSQKAIGWINGELLGDGNLFAESLYSARFNYTSKYPEYIQYIADTLKSFGIEQIGKIRKHCHKKTGCYTYHYQSRYYAEFYPIYRQWYPERKKIVPKDIELTPLTCKQWYIGDGHLAHPKNSKPNILLCTYGFLISDVEWLVGQLINIGFKVTKQLSNNAIYISTCSTKDFLNYIKKCPVECYQYKWAY